MSGMEGRAVRALESRLSQARGPQSPGSTADRSVLKLRSSRRRWRRGDRSTSVASRRRLWDRSSDVSSCIRPTGDPLKDDSLRTE